MEERRERYDDREISKKVSKKGKVFAWRLKKIEKKKKTHIIVYN